MASIWMIMAPSPECEWANKEIKIAV